MTAGILIAVYAGKELNEAIFRKVMALIIVATAIIIVIMAFRKSNRVPTHPLFVAGTGLVAGVTTMLENLAGAFSNIYFLAMQMPKSDFIGTAAWVFLVINLFKLLLQVWYWKNIDVNSLKIDLLLLPALALGFWVGVKLVEHIRDDNYRKVVIALTMAGAVVMF